jgi:protein gp37
MGDDTSISWTAATWNPWQSCHKVSPGCKNCYMFRDKEKYGQNPNVVVRSGPATFRGPLKWQREAERGDRTGRACDVFTCSWSDWFIEEADPWRDEAWDIVRRCPLLNFQVLTKRPERIADHLPADWGDGRPNVWLGVSVESGDYFGRIAVLMDIPARVRFISAEPLLEDLTEIRWGIGDLERFLHDDRSYPCKVECYPFDGIKAIPDHDWNSGKIHWLVVGGESGNPTGKYQARPCDLRWIRSIVHRCRTARVPCHVKQLGSRAVLNDIPLWFLRDRHGANPTEWPADLRVREFPEAIAHILPEAGS